MAELTPSLQNIVDQTSLQWIFVGGKGGVGKTTTSCCLSIALADSGRSVLLLSTDPAHNLSDAFGVQLTSTPSPIPGVAGLFAMEMDPSSETEEMAEGAEDPSGGFFGELMTSIPGIDEAMSFAQMMKQVQEMDYDVVVFDTAPTGHTIRLLSFPDLLSKALDKLSGMGPLLAQMGSMFTGGAGIDSGELFGQLSETKVVIDQVRDRFQDPERTTCVAVSIAEFLSLYESERLIQRLMEFGMDTRNVVVNQLTPPENYCPPWENSDTPTGTSDGKSTSCGTCGARMRIQNKYLGQVLDLYGDDFHVVQCPLLSTEVRGVPALRNFSRFLTSDPFTAPTPPPKEE